jgi:hypothetical protein
VTVIHELAHHLGIDDDRLEQLARLTGAALAAAPMAMTAAIAAIAAPTSIGWSSRSGGEPARRGCVPGAVQATRIAGQAEEGDDSGRTSAR